MASELLKQDVECVHMGPLWERVKGTMFSSWKPRFAILQPNTLAVFASKSATDPLYTLDLSEGASLRAKLKDATLQHMASPSMKDLKFTLGVDGKDHTFSTEDAAARQKWMYALHNRFNIKRKRKGPPVARVTKSSPLAAKQQETTLNAADRAEPAPAPAAPPVAPRTASASLYAPHNAPATSESVHDQPASPAEPAGVAPVPDVGDPIVPVRTASVAPAGKPRGKSGRRRKSKRKSKAKAAAGSGKSAQTHQSAEPEPESEPKPVAAPQPEPAPVAPHPSVVASPVRIQVTASADAAPNSPFHLSSESASGDGVSAAGVDSVAVEVGSAYPDTEVEPDADSEEPCADPHPSERELEFVTEYHKKRHEMALREARTSPASLPVPEPAKPARRKRRARPQKNARPSGPARRRGPKASTSKSASRSRSRSRSRTRTRSAARPPARRRGKAKDISYRVVRPTDATGIVASFPATSAVSAVVETVENAATRPYRRGRIDLDPRDADVTVVQVDLSQQTIAPAAASVRPTPEEEAAIGWRYFKPDAFVEPEPAAAPVVGIGSYAAQFRKRKVRSSHTHHSSRVSRSRSPDDHRSPLDAAATVALERDLMRRQVQALLDGEPELAEPFVIAPRQDASESAAVAAAATTPSVARPAATAASPPPATADVPEAVWELSDLDEEDSFRDAQALYNSIAAEASELESAIKSQVRILQADSGRPTGSAREGKPAVGLLVVADPSVDRGVVVSKVAPASAAADAGITVGHILVSVNGDSIDSVADMREAFTRHCYAPGLRVQFGLLSPDLSGPHSVDVVVGEAGSPPPSAPRPASSSPPSHCSADEDSASSSSSSRSCRSSSPRSYSSDRDDVSYSYPPYSEGTLSYSGNARPYSYSGHPYSCLYSDGASSYSQ
ncbi:uncharacterized protein AMSG_07485 [Thecamonas trahens ATCC 50062]|uniref:PH domain-containing protein n=1 Tax=Thecamonas trahens ATCC 50062 TaxID=461836 RepID=A0A0L0DHB4_THETB|nr:hypothetical protein AMSG_07485 [Thecamonas trahens ATCC 50062]KNC51580.1 hypothetical protein AMSG_07485 [Thecamonas trahens ATCC 50062]|eukprot:XP_013755981.1 hypothetical protein AMSG_07485 [Thecamonas trahens ATCC 50062]